MPAFRCFSLAPFGVWDSTPLHPTSQHLAPHFGRFHTPVDDLQHARIIREMGSFGVGFHMVRGPGFEPQYIDLQFGEKGWDKVGNQLCGFSGVGQSGARGTKWEKVRGSPAKRRRRARAVTGVNRTASRLTPVGNGCQLMRAGGRAGIPRAGASDRCACRSAWWRCRSARGCPG